MSNAVQQLQGWFSGLSIEERKEVVKFLYEGPILVSDGVYYGPNPNAVTKGLYAGPAPSTASSGSVCPTCGKRL